MNRCFYILSVCIGLFCIAGKIHAQTLLLQENFNLALDSLSGQNGWQECSSSINNIIITDSVKLRYANYPGENVGHAIYLSGQTDRVQKSFSEPYSKELFYSFLIQVVETGSGDYFAGLFSNGEFCSRVFVKKYGSGLKFGLQKSIAGDTVYTNSTYKFNTTYLLVVKTDIGRGTNDDIVSLHVNPDLNSPNLGQPAIASVSDRGHDAVNNILAIQARPNTGKLILDGVMVATDWETIRTGVNKDKFYLELPRFISSNMVFQRNVPLKIHGWGTQGETVVVELTREGVDYQNESFIIESGEWEVILPELQACSNPCRLTVFLKNRTDCIVQYDNILIGDVWFISGEGNMEKTMNYILDAENVIAQAGSYPLVRSFISYYNENTREQQDVGKLSNPWAMCTPQYLSDSISGIAYLFARGLYQNLNIPVGIIQSCRMDTEIETWMNDAVFDEEPVCTMVSDRIALLDSLDALSYPSLNYNGQIYPVVGFPIKGFLYYQGESNSERALDYRILNEQLIKSWRAAWGMGELPFYFVQMPNRGAPVNYRESKWADLREQQLQLLSGGLKNTGMVVTIDTHEKPNSSSPYKQKYPGNKMPVADRLTKLVLEDTYRIGTAGKSPLPEAYRISDDTVYIHFSNTGSTLKYRDGDSSLKGFAISDETNTFVEASAEIVDGNKVKVFSPQVNKPCAVRYGWADNPDCNLYNSENLPASPFRTDSWESKYYYNLPYKKEHLSNDATLFIIRENGRKIKDFDPESFFYTVNYDTDIPPITAIPNHPYAKVEIIHPNEQETERLLINVTAEDGISAHSYEILFKQEVSAGSGIKEGQINIRVKEKTLFVSNDSGESGLIMLYNIMGTCIFSGTVSGYDTRHIRLPEAGIYIVNVVNSTKKTTLKFLCP